MGVPAGQQAGAGKRGGGGAAEGSAPPPAFPSPAHPSSPAPTPLAGRVVFRFQWEARQRSGAERRKP